MNESIIDDTVFSRRTTLHCLGVSDFSRWMQKLNLLVCFLNGSAISFSRLQVTLFSLSHPVNFAKVRWSFPHAALEVLNTISASEAAAIAVLGYSWSRRLSALTVREREQFEKRKSRLSLKENWLSLRRES